MRFIDLPKELEVGVRAACALLGDSGDFIVRFQKAECLTLCKDAQGVTVGYSRKAEALRGLSMAKRFWNEGTAVSQQAKFETLTLMVDCSRNAVLKPEQVKQLMVELAMMGFTSLMLYTEDTYEIPGHPYFGHMRGRYSVQELKDLNAYGEEIGIELIPCIQTLAHLNAIFNWSAYSHIQDVGDILLAECDETYALIEDMLKTCRDCFSSRTINIGMDEAHLLGRGKYLDRFGYSPKADIMIRHLHKVMELCKKYDFQPVMWSDMFFRMQFDGKYNVSEGELSQEVLDRIPEEVALCYWNYYTPPAKTGELEHMFQQHSRIKRELWFAGGSWCWNGPAPKNYFSNIVTPTQLGYAKKYGVQNVIATVWGDDGAECCPFMVLPSLLQYAELCYGEADEKTLNDRSMDCFGISYGDLLKIDQVALPRVIDPERSGPPCYEKMALLNDVMLGIMDADLKEADLPAKYRQDAEILQAVPANRYSILFENQLRFAELLEVKTDLSVRIKEAYRAGDRNALAEIVQNRIPLVLERLERFQDTFRNQWHTYNKPFGFEVQDLRMGGIKERLRTAAIRLTQYINGEVDRLEELEQPDLPFKHNAHTDRLNRWRQIATAGVLSW